MVWGWARGGDASAGAQTAHGPAMKKKEKEGGLVHF
jgi:hypothetical protein